jgi:carboxylesterase
METGMRSLFTLIGIALFTTAAYAQTQRCDDQIAARVQAQTARQIQWYQAHGGKTPRLEDQTLFHAGTSGKAVLVLHGFLSSPDQMRDLTNALVATGHTVLAPLITGFAGGPQAANLSRIEDWQASVREAVTNLQTCYSQITIVAHCMGAALATDLVQSPGWPPDHYRMVLLAPYFRTFYPGLNILNDIVKTKTNVVDLHLLQFLLNIAPEKVLPIPLPREAWIGDDALLPLQAVESVLDLQKKFMPSPQNPRLPTRVLAFFSANDQVVDGRFGVMYLNSQFQAPRSVDFAPEQNVPHSMHRRSLNPGFERILQDTLAFIAQ